VPLSVLTSRRSCGTMARRMGLFLTPEETEPPPELAALRSTLRLIETAQPTPLPDSGIAQVVLDPYVNAIHVSLLREKRLNPAYAKTLAELGVSQPAVRGLCEKLLTDGPERLPARESLLILCDAESMSWLHHQAWLRPDETLAPWWQKAIRGYAR
jgi:membrane glycosyltransferase